MLSTISMTLFMVAATADYRQMEAEAEKLALKSNYAEAQTMYASAMEAAKLAAGPNHLDVARLTSRLALMMEMQGDLAGPAPLYQQAIKILEAPALASPTELATVLELNAGLLDKQGKTAEAGKLRERARPIRDRQVREMAAKIPPAADTAPAIKLGGGVQPPVLASKVEPEYSAVAKMAKLQASVLMMVVIGTDGTVRNVEIRRAVGLGLDEQAATAIFQWKFKPAVKDGLPVAVQATVEVNFRLQ